MTSLADFLMRNKLDALGEKPEYTTADVNALMPQQPSWDAPEWLKSIGSAELAKQEPNALGRALSTIPPEALYALNFTMRGPAKMPSARPNPQSFMGEIASRDIPAGDATLRWSPQHGWLDIIRGEQPVGRTFVTPVNSKTGNVADPDAYILGPKVEEQFRRQGIGSAVYDALQETGARHGMRQVPGLSLSREAFDHREEGVACKP